MRQPPPTARCCRPRGPGCRRRRCTAAGRLPPGWPGLREGRHAARGRGTAAPCFPPHSRRHGCASPRRLQANQRGGARCSNGVGRQQAVGRQVGVAVIARATAAAGQPAILLASLPLPIAMLASGAPLSGQGGQAPPAVGCRDAAGGAAPCALSSQQLVALRGQRHYRPRPPGLGGDVNLAEAGSWALEALPILQTVIHPRLAMLRLAQGLSHVSI